MHVTDDSDIKLRSAELDIARKWFPLVNLYELVDLFAYYKINHLQFHFNDHGMFTFGSEVFPELRTITKTGDKHYYTLKELKELAAYADARGVSLIPEIEMPSHTDAPRILPKIFGTKDPATGEYKPSGYINVTRDDTVEACAKLINEAMDVFSSSEYISIGADEVPDIAFTKMSEYPDFQKHHPGEKPLDHLIAAMDAVAKKRGKTLMVYGRGGPPDVLQMPWSGNDNELASSGYMLMPHNTGSVTHHMPTFMVPPYNTILLYSGFQDGYEFDFTRTNKISPKNVANVVGIQTLTWQHWHEMAFKDLRETMSSIAENAWNYSTHDKFMPFERWRDARWNRADARLDDLVFPVKIEPEGLLSPGKDIVFYKSMSVKLSSPHRGTIRYQVKPLDYWNPPTPPTAVSPVYTSPIIITEPSSIYAQLFDDTGKSIGYGTERHYYPIEPKLMCDAYPVIEIVKVKPGSGSNAPLPSDSSSLAKLNLKPAFTFPLGRLTFQPSYEGVYQLGWYYVMKGTLQIPETGDYEFRAYGNQSSIAVDGRLAASILGKTRMGNKIKLTTGRHPYEVIAVSGTNSAKVVEMKGPQDADFRPVDDFTVLLSQFASASTQ